MADTELNKTQFATRVKYIYDCWAVSLVFLTFWRSGMSLGGLALVVCAGAETSDLVVLRVLFPRCAVHFLFSNLKFEQC